MSGWFTIASPTKEGPAPGGARPADKVRPADEAVRAADRAPLVQPKLSVGAPDDPYERQADEMADTVMRMPAGNFLQRKCAECEKEELVQRQEDENGLYPDLNKHKEEILELLQKKDHLGLLGRLRVLNGGEASVLLLDEDFMAEIKSAYSGAALWAVFTALFFGNHIPPLQSQLSMALGGKKITEVMDTLAVIIARHSVDNYVAKKTYWQVLEDVIWPIFTGDPGLQDLFRMIIHHDKDAAMPTKLKFDSPEVHFEPTGGDDSSGRLTMASDSSTQMVYVTGHEFRVVVTIRFTDALNPGQPYYFRGPGEAALPDKWKAEIESVWNNKFEVMHGAQRLKFAVSVLFTNEAGQEDQTVIIVNDPKKNCHGQSEPGRSFENCWFTNAGTTTVAHEFGHMLGAIDEYNLPGSARDVPKHMRDQMTEEQLERTTYGGIEHMYQKPGSYTLPGLMGDMGSTKVKARNIQALISEYNRRQPEGAPAYEIIKP